ncbi:MAG TPA: hypothetical protein VKE93_02185 [Candidatus Angelobacter sp.]|nr:hypothetical protein [Candidatus Angelobacter sp.]
MTPKNFATVVLGVAYWLGVLTHASLGSSNALNVGRKRVTCVVQVRIK